MAQYTVLLLLLMSSSFCWCRPQANESSSHCDSCREISGFTRRLLDINSIPDVKANLTKWCDSEGPAPREVCSRYIDSGFGFIQRLGTDSFCGNIGACASNFVVVDDSVSRLADDTSCDFCVNVVTHVKGIVSDPQTEKQLEQVLVRSCDHCPVKDECITVLDKNIGNVFKCLRDHLNPRKFCESSGFCRATTSQNPSEQTQSIPSLSDVVGVLPVQTHELVPFTRIEPADAVALNGNPMNCLICKQVAVWAIKKLKDNRTEEAIVHTLDEVCDRIFSKGKQTECEAFVKQYTDELIGIFKETDDPKLICILLGVCSKAPTSSSNSVSVANCNYCVSGSRWLLNRVQNMQSDLMVHEEVGNVCNSDAVPDSARPVCRDFVSQNDAVIESLIRETKSPNLICWKLNVCRNVWNVSEEMEGEEIQSLPSCYICKEIAKWVNHQVERNRTEESIEAALSTVCKFMKNVDNCQAKVNDWSSRLITVLRQASQPELACELIQVCGLPSNEIETEEETAVIRESGDVSSDGVCYECQTITHFIQEELYSYDKEKRVEDFVIKNACDKITADVGKETCESFVNQYGPAVMQLIAMKVFDSKVVCEKELHICPKSQAMLPSNPSSDVEISSQNTCAMCVTSVRELDTLLSSGSIDREISKLAATACARIPQQDQRQCVTLIEAFGPYFLQMIGRMSNPRQVCKELDLCSDPGEVQLLGGHKCSYGPSYWCHTIAHANACKAEDYCRRVWEPIEQTE